MTPEQWEAEAAWRRDTQRVTREFRPHHRHPQRTRWSVMDRLSKIYDRNGREWGVEAVQRVHRIVARIHHKENQS